MTSERNAVRVFVHGNPETSAVWSPLIDALVALGQRDDDVVLLSPPGFGSPIPDGFDCSSDAYLAWLAEAVVDVATAQDGEVDIVGHDWGAGHVFRLAGERPDLIRSWAADVGGLLHPDYVWHDAAKAWQTPEVGEEVIEMMTAAPLDERVAMYEGLGLSNAIAADMAAAAGPEMGRAILALYRSAPEPVMAEFADRLAAAEPRPGLVITAMDDAYVAADLAGPVAERMGAAEMKLDGAGHWWMMSHSDEAAAGLIDFWSKL